MYKEEKKILIFLNNFVSRDIIISDHDGGKNHILNGTFLRLNKCRNLNVYTSYGSIRGEQCMKLVYRELKNQESPNTESKIPLALV